MKPLFTGGKGPSDADKAALVAFVIGRVRAGLTDEQVYEEAVRDPEAIGGFQWLSQPTVRDGIAYIATHERAKMQNEQIAKAAKERKFTAAAADHLKLLELLQERLPSMIESIKAAQAILAVEPEA